MRRQIIVFLALPGGFDGTNVRLSVLMTPRLTTNEGTTLGLFPDWVDWAKVVRSMTWRVKLGTKTVTPTRVSAKPLSNTWTAMFDGNTPLRSFAFRGLHDRTIHSYPAANIDDFLTDRYTKIARDSPEEAPAVSTLLTNAVLGKIAWKPPRAGRPGGRADALARLGSKFENGVVPPGPSDPAVDFVQADLFLRPRQPAGSTPRAAATAEDMDFHQALSLVGRHPGLMRAAGLVVDFELPSAQLPTGAASFAVSVSATWTPQLNALGGTTVQIRPKTMTNASSFLPKARNASSEVQDGFVVLGDGTARLVGVDMLNATNRLLRFGGMLRRREEPEHDRHHRPEAETMPSLTQHGLSLIRTGRAGRARDRFTRMRDLNTLLENAASASPPGTFTLYADDLLRGVRYDVFDTVAHEWRSLTARQTLTGFYTINGPKGTVNVPAAPDEGWVGTTPGTDGTEDGDVFLSEVLARWTGWSLVASRPGNIVDGETGESMPPPPNEPTPDSVVQLAVDYAATPGTLPRLRFGRKYRMRARAVDPAGNSVPLAQGNPPGTSSPAATYGRFDPVGAPAVMRRVPRDVPHDATDRIVIRGNYDLPDTAVSPAQRHVAPPSVSQGLVEQHGEPSGGVDPATYADLVARDGAALEDVGTLDPETGEYFFDGNALPIPYLPDPMAQGAALQGVPGSSGPVKPLFRTTGLVYPEAKAFRLIVKAGTGPPVVKGQTVTVFLPKATVAKVRLSSILSDLDLGQFALWNRLASGDRAALKDAVVGGRHWMFTPSRELTLVHAVRQPLKRPTFPTLFAPRPREGATFAEVTGTLNVNVPSTDRVTLSATWTDTIDDPTQAAPVEVTHDARLEPVPVDPDTAGNVVLIPNRRLDVSDTKHHEVDVTGEAVSRFVRFFEESTVVTLSGTTAQQISAGEVIAETVAVRSEDGSVGYRRDADYTLSATAPATIARTADSAIPDGASVKAQFVAPPVSRLSTEGGRAPTRVRVPSSARPAPPDVRAILPIWQRTVSGSTITRTSRAVRVYLGRPWLSSGLGELLGVILTTYQDEPFGEISELTTRFGRDPLWDTGSVDPYPDPEDFPLGVRTGENLTLPEVTDQDVHVVGHDVLFDAERGLWYADIRALANRTYMPFVRLGLVRYQPDSMPGLELSPPVVPDVVQLLPDRTLTVAQGANALDRTVTVTGISYLEFPASAVRNPKVYVAVQEADPAIPDPDLKWVTVAGQANGGKGVSLTRTAPASATSDTTWSGTVTLPSSGGPFRLLVREAEGHQEGPSGGPFTSKERVVYLETFDL